MATEPQTELDAYSAYLVAHGEYAALVGSWRDLFSTPRFRRAFRRQRELWAKYDALVAQRFA